MAPLCQCLRLFALAANSRTTDTGPLASGSFSFVLNAVICLSSRAREAVSPFSHERLFHHPVYFRSKKMLRKGRRRNSFRARNANSFSKIRSLMYSFSVRLIPSYRPALPHRSGQVRSSTMKSQVGLRDSSSFSFALLVRLNFSIKRCSASGLSMKYFQFGLLPRTNGLWTTALVAQEFTSR